MIDEHDYLRNVIGNNRVSEIFRTIAGFMWSDDFKGFKAWRLNLGDTENRFIHLACERLGAFTNTSTTPDDAEG